ncbi:hypothetical protein IWX49DRAFT_557245 [Phyllosticta citricarpa]
MYTSVVYTVTFSMCRAKVSLGGDVLTPDSRIHPTSTPDPSKHARQSVKKKVQPTKRPEIETGDGGRLPFSLRRNSPIWPGVLAARSLAAVGDARPSDCWPPYSRSSTDDSGPTEHRTDRSFVVRSERTLGGCQRPKSTAPKTTRPPRDSRAKLCGRTRRMPGPKVRGRPIKKHCKIDLLGICILLSSPTPPSQPESALWFCSRVPTLPARIWRAKRYKTMAIPCQSERSAFLQERYLKFSRGPYAATVADTHSVNTIPMLQNSINPTQVRLGDIFQTYMVFSHRVATWAVAGSESAPSPKEA